MTNKQILKLMEELERETKLDCYEFNKKAPFSNRSPNYEGMWNIIKDKLNDVKKNK